MTFAWVERFLLRLSINEKPTYYLVEWSYWWMTNMERNRSSSRLIWLMILDDFWWFFKNLSINCFQTDFLLRNFFPVAAADKNGTILLRFGKLSPIQSRSAFMGRFGQVLGVITYSKSRLHDKWQHIALKPIAV